MPRPLLIYDGTCGFCKRWVLRLHRITQAGFDYKPFQEIHQQHPDIPLQDFRTAAQFLESDGTRHSGADAMFFALCCGAGPQWPRTAYLHFPGVKPVTNLGYRWVARHRSGVSALDRFFLGDSSQPEHPPVSGTQQILATLTGLAFLYYGISSLPRWQYLENWDPWAIVAALVGGPLLALAYLLKMRRIFRVTGKILVVLAAASPLAAIGTFIAMRVPLAWTEWFELSNPVLLLLLLLTQPLFSRILRSLTTSD
jgi:predicted DCC family thiol-disulfide oxidoreductase YuxK